MGLLLKSFVRLPAKNLLGARSLIDTDRSLLEEDFPQRFMKLPETSPEKASSKRRQVFV
jgi:hypothetical protein